ncbi:MAG: hypothetical protein JNL12_09740 [Planctomycetes bacterium]|nr:hypothetical protein [Planctomycetota bacterium]
MAYEAAEVGEKEPTSLVRSERLGPVALREFLESPEVADAVLSGCGEPPYPMEERLVSILDRGHDDERALALSVLVRVRAPRHIVRQWQSLHDLEQRHGADSAWSPLLAALREPFAPNQLGAVLRRERILDCVHPWAIRAVGVTGCRQLLPRVAVWARHADWSVAEAAETSLDEFTGLEADQALADCLVAFGAVAGWAGHDLLRRDPALLTRTLLAAEVPASEQDRVGLLLARLEHPAAVPHLCASVGSRAIIGREMFDAIERLATADHWPLVEALPNSVRPEQRERATAVVTAVRARLKL